VITPVAELIKRAPPVHFFATGYGSSGLPENIAIAPRCKNRFSWKRWRR